MKRAKKSQSKTPDGISFGALKVPTTTILAIAGLFLGGGGLAAGQMNSSNIDELKQAQLQIAEMRNDIAWIKKYLSEDRAQNASHSAPLKRDSRAPQKADAGSSKP